MRHIHILILAIFMAPFSTQVSAANLFSNTNKTPFQILDEAFRSAQKITVKDLLSYEPVNFSTVYEDTNVVQPSPSLYYINRVTLQKVTIILGSNPAGPLFPGKEEEVITEDLADILQISDNKTNTTKEIDKRFENCYDLTKLKDNLYFKQVNTGVFISYNYTNLINKNGSTCFNAAGWQEGEFRKGKNFVVAKMTEYKVNKDGQKLIDKVYYYYLWK
ncbi:MAG: hypothetical protein KDD58_12120 [Bdellovibrionales bacterium]|nr:hypothetical protein [Bdellovibrionales bacterium]